MSQQIVEHRVVQFAETVNHLAQQKMSRFRSALMNHPHSSGKRVSVDYLGTRVATKKITRHGDTPLTDTPHTRRWINLSPFEDADLVDDADKLRTITDPTNQYVVAMSRSYGRAIDDESISAMLGTSITGEEATGTQAFLAAQIIPVAGAGLTMAKLLQANRMLRAAEFDIEDGFFIAVTQKQIENMLSDSTFTSADYNLKLLMSGAVTSFLGFTWVNSERLTNNGSGNRQCLAWAKPAVGISFGAEPKARITERADKSFSTQVFYSMDMGVSRLQDNGVVSIVCQES